MQQSIFQRRPATPRSEARLAGSAASVALAMCLAHAAPATADPAQTPPPQPAHSTADMEKALNFIDRKDAWSRTPVSGTRAAPAGISRQAQPAGPQSLRPMPQGGQQAGPANLPSRVLPGVSRKDAARMFFEGGTPQQGGPPAGRTPRDAQSSGNSGTAYSNYQTAENESTKARNEANTARYDSNKWNRKNAASRAEYAANSANNAAEQAEAAAYSGDAQARSYANLARQAANRARASANQARYNAETSP